jgi:hypothetical protein
MDNWILWDDPTNEDPVGRAASCDRQLRYYLGQRVFDFIPAAHEDPDTTHTLVAGYINLTLREWRSLVGRDDGVLTFRQPDDPYEKTYILEIPADPNVPDDRGELNRIAKDAAVRRLFRHVQAELADSN